MTSVTSFEVAINGSDEVSKLTAWRKKGPIRKLHNTVIHIKENATRRLLFQSKQRNAVPASKGKDSEVVRMYRVVANRGIRWNSTYLMIDRTMLLKDAIHLY